MTMTSSLRRCWLRLLNALRPDRGEADLARELTAHRQLLEEEYVRRGLSDADARAAAARALGGELRVKEQHRDARSLGWIDDLRRDVRYALRMCRRSPGFTLVAVLTLAIGIGANTAIFSVVRAVVLRPLPYRDAERLVHPFENVPAADAPNRKAQRIGGMIVSELLQWRVHSRTLSHVVASSQLVVTMLGGSDSVMVNGSTVTAGTFDMLGVAPALGRSFSAAEEGTAEHVVLLSDVAWRKYFDADPRVVGRQVTFAGNTTFSSGIAYGTAYTIVGVMPRGFHYPWEPVEFWVPAVLKPAAEGRPRRTSMIAQLAPGASLASAAAELTGIVADLRGKPSIRTDARPPRFELTRLEDEVTDPVKPALLVLSAAVAFVLLIACANVANLLLARMAARQREMAVRAAIGASRWRLARQTLAESLVLGAMGGAAGVGLAVAGVALFRRLGTALARFDLGTASAAFPNVTDIAIDRGVLLFALAASVGTGVLLGCLPAARSDGASRMDWLREAASARGFGIRRGRLMQSALVVAEIGMAMMLFVSGALLMRSFVNLATMDPGYDAAHVLTFQVGARGDRYTPAQLQTFADDVAARLRASPQIVAAGYARQLPMVQLLDGHAFRSRPDGEAREPADARYISPGYLQAIGARLVAGRWPSRPRDVLVNQTLARREFGTASPVGRAVFIGSSAIPSEVVGVVEDERLVGLDRVPPAQFFADLSLWTGPNVLPLGPYYAVRTVGDPEAVLATVRDVVREIDEHAPIYNVATLEAIISNSVTVPRMYAVLLGIFAGIAVGLAAIGIYGVVAFTVAERTREIGIRIALGARPREVLGLVLRQCGALTAGGLVLGVVGAAAGSRYLEGLLFGITAFDGTTVAGAGAVFATIAIAAALQPARKATRVDPAIALRCE